MTEDKNKIAIIGMSGKYPEANHLYKFYENLSFARDSVREINNIRKINSSLDLRKSYRPIGHLNRVDLFDHSFFGISKGEAELMNPAHRMLLELSCEAIENAGYALNSLAGSDTAVYLSCNGNLDYARLGQSTEGGTFTGNLYSMAAGRIAHMLDLRGGAMMIDTSCSSSLVAVHEACQKLKHGEMTLALAGGINTIITFPVTEESIDTLGISSPDGKCRTFDEKAEGTGMGEGGGILLLKRLDKAMEDNDLIHAIIIGSAINQDGGSSNGLTAPSPVAQRAVILKALADSKVTPESIGYVEAHGTGTKLGDPIEFQALSEALAPSGEEKPLCALSTVKTNIGHLGNSAGIAGLTKSILSLKHKTLFPSLHFNSPNSFIELKGSRFYINTVTRKWETSNGPLRCGVSSFGLTGTNAHMILEEAIKQNNFKSKADQDPIILKISAKTRNAIQNYIQNIKTFLIDSEEDFNSILYTLNVGRDDYSYRICLTANSKDELINKLINRNVEVENSEGSTFSTAPRQVVILFSDEISELKSTIELFYHYPLFKQYYDHILTLAENYSISNAIKTFAVQVSLYRCWEQWGVSVKTIISTGIGGISKQVAIGEITIKQALDQIGKGNLSFSPTDKGKLKKIFTDISKSYNPYYLEMGIGGLLSYELNVLKQAEILNDIECDAIAEIENLKYLPCKLARLYESGVSVNWKEYYNGKERTRIEAPTYPFDEIRCWISPPSNLKTIINDWSYKINWKQIPLSNTTQVSTTQTYLVFMDNGRLGEELVFSLEKEGNTCIKVFQGEKFKELSPNIFEISRTNEEDYTLLASNLNKKTVPSYVIHLGNFDLPNSEDPDEILSQGLYSQLLMSKVFSIWFSDEFHFMVITKNSRSINGMETPYFPEYSTSYGFLLGLTKEYPRLSAHCIDVDDENILSGNIVDSILNEIKHNSNTLGVSLRKGKRFLPFLEKINLAKKESIFESNDAWIITGGASGIGLEVLKFIGKEQPIILIAIGRSVLPSYEEWASVQNDPTHKHYYTIKSFLEIEALGSTVHYYSSDIGDIKQLSKVAKHIKKSVGIVSGIVHSAGLPGKKRVVNHSIESFRETLIPKVHGAINLVKTFTEVKTFISFSSHSAIIGYDRCTNYSAANVFLDNFTNHLLRKGIRAISINWPGWKETGMLHRITNMEMISSADNQRWLTINEGIEAFDCAIHGGYNNVIISKVDPSLMGENKYLLFDENKTHMGSLNPSITTETKTDSINSLIFSEEDVKNKITNIWYTILKNETISVEDDFFEIGGHSINGTQVINQIEKELKTKLEFEDLYTYSTLEKLSNHVFRQLDEKNLSFQDQIPLIQNKEYYPTSHSQKRIWIMSQLEGGSIAYNEPGGYILEGELNQVAFSKSIESLFIRHESLRTVFKSIDGEIVQIIKKPSEFDFKIIYSDFSNEDNKGEKVKQIVLGNVQRAFDLEKGPLIRAILIRLEPSKHIFVFTMHHIISDRWSVLLLTKEFLLLYEAFTSNSPNPLPQLRFQYKDYASWHNSQLTEEKSAKYKKYWLKQLSGEIPRLKLPSDFPAPSVRSFNGNSQSIILDKKTRNELINIGYKKEATLYMKVVAIVITLLYKHSRQTDIILGTPVSGRLHKDLENQIGIFINILVLRIAFSPENSFIQLLDKVKQVVLDGFKHQFYPYDLIIDDLKLGLDRSKASPLFDVGIDFYSFQEVVDQLPEVLNATYYDTGFRSNTFDLRFRFINHEDNLTLTIDYNEDIFSAERITRLLKQFKTLTERIIINPCINLDLLDFIPDKEKTKSLSLGQHIRRYPFENKDVISLFKEQVEKTPQKVALRLGDISLTYDNLNKLSISLANYLVKNCSHQLNDIVAVLLERSEYSIIAILGIMRAGGIYLPIDSKYPDKRIATLLSDSKSKFLLLDREIDLDIQYQGMVLDLEILYRSVPDEVEILQFDSYQFKNAYLIYTSGSTGVPKGCLINHLSLSNRISYFINYLGVSEKSKILQLASFGFDASLFEIFITLLSGGQLVIASKEEKNNMDRLIRLIEKNEVTVATFPPTFLNILNKRKFSSLKTIISTGEAAILNDALFYSQFLDFYNGYGPTETCIGATFYKLNNKLGEYYKKINSIPIGQPFSFTSIYVLNDMMELVPIGNEGEIYIGGIGLSSGYLNNPELTDGKFVANPFSVNDDDKILYRSGDIGRWNEYGDLEYKGRKDSQVQIHGVRVELNEIQNIILSHPAVGKAAVIVKENNTLVSFVQKKSLVELWPDVNTVNVFDSMLYHSMGEDTVRIKAFKRAFDKHLRDKVVLDVGTGQNALLAIIAAECGARKVYAVEMNEVACQNAERLVQELGLNDRIEIVKGDIQTVRISEKADYCIFDLSGNSGSSGGAIVLINSAKRLLKESGSILPNRYLTLVCGITLPPEELELCFSEIPGEYVKRMFEITGYPFDVRLSLKHFPLRNCITPQGIFEDLDFKEVVPEDANHNVKLIFRKNAIFHGLLLSLRVYIDEEIKIDHLHDGDVVLPVFIPLFWPGISVNKNDYISFAISRRTSDNGTHPDYLINGKLHIGDHEPILFAYNSYNHKKVFRSNPFYDELFKGDKINVSEKFSGTQLIEFLKKRLPLHMVPHKVAILEELPLTINGKVDSKALMAMKLKEPVNFGKPSNLLEKRILRIWCAVLNKENISVLDNFFEIGGHSLKANQMISRLYKGLGIRLDMKSIFVNPTIKALAQSIKGKSKIACEPILPLETQEFHEVSHSQRRIWAQSQMRKSSLSYNLISAYIFEGQLNTTALINSFNALIERHESLRTVFVSVEGNPYQKIISYENMNFEVAYEDISVKQDVWAFIQEVGNEELSKPFDLRIGPLFRAKLLKINEESHIFIFIVHHIIFDEWSMNVAVKDIAKCYDSFARNEPNPLDKLNLQYKDFAHWQNKQFKSKQMKLSREYWLERLSSIPIAKLPKDNVRSIVLSYEGGNINALVKMDLANKLKAYAHQQNGSLFMGLLALVRIFLFKLCDQTDVIIGTPLTGRDDISMEDQIGFYLNTLALRRKLSPEDSFKVALAKEVKETLTCFQHGRYPFDLLVNDLKLSGLPERSSALFDVHLVLQNEDFIIQTTSGGLSNINIRRFGNFKPSSKFELEFIFTEAPEGLILNLLYKRDSFEDATVELMKENFLSISKELLNNPDVPIKTVESLSDIEKEMKQLGDAIDIEFNFD